ncbi:MAG: LysR family transcriptional regulator [Alphaproteobacteria bacterium]|nr:LysR family transcriptional regulator [Alphaproteobacteria bacterium]
MRALRLESIDLNLLLALHWLLEEQNVTAAATKLSLSQPAMSRALSRLRDLLDDALFVQTGRRMLPTPYAESLRPALADAIERLRTTLRPRDDFTPVRATGSFRIACNDYLALVLARAWQRSVRSIAPGLDLEISTLDPGTFQRLMSGAVDLVVMPDVGIANLPRTLDVEQFVRRPLLEEDFACVARRGHPAAGKRLTAKQFAALDHILVSPSGQGLGVVDRLLKEHGAERRIVYRVQNFLAAQQILNFTDCVAVLPRRLVDASNPKPAKIKAPFDIPGFKVISAWHPLRTNDALHRWAREQLAKALQ